MIEIIEKTLMITAFVAVMMLIIEYLNVQTRGLFLNALTGSRPRQYLVAALLGAVPGCLGAFVVVTLFAHRKISVGAVVTTMITTSGDETFVMLALFPTTALLLTAGLAFLGVLAGWLTDAVLPEKMFRAAADACSGLRIHATDECRCFSWSQVAAQWHEITPYRATLMVALSLLVFAVTTGHIGPTIWGWKRITLLVVMLTGLFIVSTVPDNFLEKHLWRHVAKRHVPRVFLWTGGVITAVTGLVRVVDLRSLVSDNPVTTMVIAALVGVLPESGPHLIFVTMFDERIAPLSVLVASSIVQDGHGMLPLLSASKKAFVVVKIVNLLIGIAVGGAMLFTEALFL